MASRSARKRVDSNVRTLVNLLTADHLPADWQARQPANELGRLTERFDGFALEARGLEHAAELVPFEGSPAMEPLFPINPFADRGLGGLFGTHPPVAERVRRLRALAPAEPAS